MTIVVDKGNHSEEDWAYSDDEDNYHVIIQRQLKENGWLKDPRDPPIRFRSIFYVSGQRMKNFIKETKAGS